MRYVLLLLVLFIALPLSAQQDNVLTDTAVLSSVEAEATEEGVMLTVRGDFPDSCTELGAINQNIETSGDTITVTVTIETSRPADAMCAQVLTGFEESFLLDTSELAPGTYTLIVNGIETEISIDPTACPEVQEETFLYAAQGICFLYPENYTEISGEGFVLISVPNSNNALLLVEIMPEDESLEEISSNFEENSPARLGAQEAFIVEDSEADMRQAYVVFEGNRYIFTLQPTNEESGGVALWELLMSSLYFSTETLED